MTAAAQTDLFGGPAPRRFDEDALGFLIRFARKHKGQPFSSEQVTLAALKRGIAPQDLRAWGAIFTQAARGGHIRRSEVLFQRSRGNGTLAPGWVGT
jgi:hypothetical protein